MKMEHSRESIAWNLICILLVFAAWILQLMIKHYDKPYSYNSFILVLFTAAILIWTIQMRRRLLASYIRTGLTAAAALMLFWMVLRTIKYEFIPDEYEILRHIWYLYYVPILCFYRYCILENQISNS